MIFLGNRSFPSLPSFLTLKKTERVVSRILSPTSLSASNHSSRNSIARVLKRRCRSSVENRVALQWVLLRIGFTNALGSPNAASLLKVAFHPVCYIAAAAVCFLLYFPWPCGPQSFTGILSCEVQTFLCCTRQQRLLLPSR
jgi:hypothetical protein